MLKYRETNWKAESGFDTKKYDLAISTISPSKVRKEQHKRIEKISLVTFLSEDNRKILNKICRRLKKNNSDFYQNTNLHATLFGFGPINKYDYQTIRRQIETFTESHKACIKIKIDSIRPGSMYYGKETLIPVKGLGNGTVIAIGDVCNNIEFSKYANSLTRFLASNKNLQSVTDKKYRRKFPTVWITLGYYNKKYKFKIDTELEDIFKEYSSLGQDYLFPVSELSLVKSKYKNLRYPKLIQKYRL